MQTRSYVSIEITWKNPSLNAGSSDLVVFVRRMLVAIVPQKEHCYKIKPELIILLYFPEIKLHNIIIYNKTDTRKEHKQCIQYTESNAEKLAMLVFFVENPPVATVPKV